MYLRKPQVRARPAQFVELPDGWIVYITLEGDTLDQLALDSGLSVNQLLLANCLDDNNLEIGQSLFLPNYPATATVTLTSTATSTATRTATFRFIPATNTPTRTPTRTPNAYSNTNTPHTNIHTHIYANAKFPNTTCTQHFPTSTFTLTVEPTFTPTPLPTNTITPIPIYTDTPFPTPIYTDTPFVTDTPTKHPLMQQNHQ